MTSALRIILCVGLLAAFALLAGSAGAGSASAGPAAGETSQATDVVDVKFVINRFARQGRRIVAHGAVIATHRSAERPATMVRKPFVARLKAGQISYAGSTRICNVLELDLKQLRLELLGLILELDRVHLTITADSEGGILGRLFCSLAGRQTASAAKLRKTATKMTRAAHRNGLDRQGIANFRAQAAPGLAQAGQVCLILDLVLGPLDLNLLGLMIHLDRVHLRITADPEGGILGRLLCALADGPPPPPPAPLMAPNG
jgi:hypothetical protein